MLDIKRRSTVIATLLVLHTIFATPAAFGAPRAPGELKARVQSLHAKGNPVTITTSEKSVLRGRIVRLDDDSFTVREEKSLQETIIPYAQLKEIKGGSSGHKKAILIPVAIVGGAVLVLCAAPYPIGFLCHKDPS